MKVECIKIISAMTGQQQSKSRLLTIGQTYLVLSIFADPGRNIQFRIIGNNSATPVLFDSQQFRITSHTIPSTWVVTGDEQGAIWLTPETWARPGFWEDYFNNDAEALQQFDQELTRLVAETT